MRSRSGTVRRIEATHRWGKLEADRRRALQSRQSDSRRPAYAATFVSMSGEYEPDRARPFIFARCRYAACAGRDVRRRRRPTPSAPAPAAPGRRRTTAPTGAAPSRSSRSGARSRPRRSGRRRGRRSPAPPPARGAGSSVIVCSATSWTPARLGRLVAGEHHVRLQQHLLEVDALVAQLGEDRVQRPRGDVERALDRVVAVHQHLGLDDRHEPGLLARARRSGRARARSSRGSTRSGCRRRS